MALRRFAPRLPLSSAMVCTDNSTVACYLNKQGGSRSQSLSIPTEDLLLWCFQRHIQVRARHVPGALNIVADQLSRRHVVLTTEWTLVHKVLSPLWLRWFRPMVDLFATRFNYRLPSYVSPVPDPGAWGVDALSFSWEGLSAYAYPPPAILSRVVRKLAQERPHLILVTPLWESQPWFPELSQLSHEDPVPLLIGPRSLLQPRSGGPHGSPNSLRLHAWLLCPPLCGH